MTQFMHAHGNDPGRTLRPYTAGALAGLLAAAVALLIMHWSSALAGAADALHVPGWLLIPAFVGLFTTTGLAYGWLFSRAAMDIGGGWLFGMSFGFLIWMLGPATLVQWITSKPLVTGRSALGLFTAHLAWGLTTGLLYPWVHKAIVSLAGDPLRLLNLRK